MLKGRPIITTRLDARFLQLIVLCCALTNDTTEMRMHADNTNLVFMSGNDTRKNRVQYNTEVEYFDKLVEERIQEAQEEGVFDNLPGQGKPLNLDDDCFVPGEIRLVYKILKNSNCLPIEMEMRKEIFNLRQLLNAAIDEETRRELRRELNLLILNLNLRSPRQFSMNEL